MLLLGYIFGFCALFLLSRKRSENARSLILMGYNYLFVAVMLTLNQVLGQPVTFEGLAETILKSIYASPPSMTFRGSMNSTSGVQQVAILCLVSIYTLRTAWRMASSSSATSCSGAAAASQTWTRLMRCTSAPTTTACTTPP